MCMAFLSLEIVVCTIDLMALLCIDHAQLEDLSFNVFSSSHLHVTLKDLDCFIDETFRALYQCSGLPDV